MTGVICDSQAKADAYAAAIDAKKGYPRAGIGMDGAVYPAPGYGSTVRHANVVKHPTLSQWAYLDDSDTKETVKVALPASATVTTLDPSWFPTL